MSYHCYIYRLRLKGFSPKAEVESQAHQVPQWYESIAEYQAQHQRDKVTPFLCNKRMYFASKDWSPLGSDIVSKDGSFIKSERATLKRKSSSGWNG